MGSWAYGVSGDQVVGAVLAGPQPHAALSPGDRQITVQWQAPYADPGAPVTGYRVELSTSAAGPAVSAVELAAEATSTVFGELTNGAAYYVRVLAHSRVGDSQGYWQGAVTPITKPGVPTNVVATGDVGAVQLTWNPPTGTAAGTYVTYRVDAFTDAAGTARWGSPINTSSTYWYTGGLTPGQKLWLRVTAVNSVGEGPPSALYPVTVQ